MEDSRRLASIFVPWAGLIPLGDQTVPLSGIAPRAEPPSPLMLSDRLLTLAKDAESAGCVSVAHGLLALAHTVLDPPESSFGIVPS